MNAQNMIEHLSEAINMSLYNNGYKGSENQILKRKESLIAFPFQPSLKKGIKPGHIQISFYVAKEVLIFNLKIYKEQK